MYKIFLCFLCFFCAYGYAVDQEIGSQKKILVLSSKGGYGHAAAVNSLERLLGDGYVLQVVHPIDHMLRSSGVSSGEQWYNLMLAKGWIRSMNFLARRMAPYFFCSNEEKLEKIIHACIEEHHPELVISVIPFINYPASEAARKADLPYLVITTDNDLRNWSYGLEKIKHPLFQITIGADLPTTRDVLLRKNIPESCIQTIGLPLRPDFIDYSTEADLRKEYQISPEKPVILVMMGGAGSTSGYDYARKIGALDLSTHLIICTGRYEKLKKDLEKIELHPSNSMTIIGFTDKIADLMAMADLIITKPGPGTINEAIAMQLPVIVDNTEVSLFWERANTDMITRYGIGQGIKNLKTLEATLEGYLSEGAVREGIRKSFAALPPNLFHEKIKEVIDGLLVPREPGLIAMEDSYIPTDSSESTTLD